MRLGKPTRLERQMHRSILQQKAQEWARENGYKPKGAPDSWVEEELIGPLTPEEEAELHRRPA